MANETELVITRTFEAPRQLVYDAWTRAEHLERWQGAPKGMTVSIAESDIRTGGRFRLNMKGADGTDHWLSGVYHDVTRQTDWSLPTSGLVPAATRALRPSLRSRWWSKGPGPC